MTMPIKFNCKANAAVFLALVFLGAPVLGGPANEPPAVTRGEFVKNLYLTGSLEAQKAERFRVPRTNRWELPLKWMLPEGAVVKPGDSVARFDTATLVSDIETQETQLEVKIEQRAQKLADYKTQEFEQQVKLKQAEVEFKKKQIDASIPKGITTDYEYDNAQLALKKSAHALESARIEMKVTLADLKAEIKGIDLEIEDTRRTLRDNKNQLDQMTLTAATGGTLVYANHEWNDRKIQVGDTLWPGWEVCSIPDKQSLLVEAWVNETDIHLAKPGQKVVMYPDAYPDRRFSGTVSDVQKSAEERDKWGKAHYFRVDIALDKPDLGIMKPGMSIKCIVEVLRRANLLLVPLEMAHFDGNDLWIKTKGHDPIKLDPVGFDEFQIAMVPNEKQPLSEGTVLEPVNPSTIPGILSQNQTQAQMQTQSQTQMQTGEDK